MRRVIYISLSLLALFEMRVFAKEICLPYKLTVDLPETMVQDTTSNYLFCAYDSTIYLLISSVETSDFHSKEILNTLESYSFNLNQMNIQCNKEEKDKLYEWNKDYVKKYYTGENISLITYTFYTADRPYSVLLQYNGEEGLQTANNIISSIKYNGNLWKQICLTYKRAILFWWLFFLLIYPAICLVCTLLFERDDKELNIKRPYIASVICATPILIITLWGSWISFIVYLLITIAAFFPCFVIGMVAMEKILGEDKKIKSKSNNNSSDFDFDNDHTDYGDIVGL